MNILSKKYKLFIVSNCENGYIEAFFEYSKLDKCFADYEHPGRLLLPKGETIKFIIARNNLSAPIYVGNTFGDMQAAKHADIPFIYASYGFGNANEYDSFIEQFEDLIYYRFLSPNTNTPVCKQIGVFARHNAE